MFLSQNSNSLITIILSLLIIIGVIGNLLNMMVFLSKTMRKNSTFRYLFYLSAIDLLVLITCTTDSLLTYGYYVMIRLQSDFLCKIHTFLAYFLTHMSSLILMMVSIDRLLIIKDQSNNKNNNNQHPISSSRFRILIVNKVGKVIIYLSIVLTLFNLHYLIFMSRNSIDNIKLYEYEKILNLNSSFVSKIVQKLNISVNSYLKSDDNESNHFVFNEILSDIDFYSISQRNSLFRNYENINNSNIIPLYMCYPNDYTNYYYFITRIWIWIDMIIFSLIPFMVMVICSSIIIHHIRDSSKNFLASKSHYNIKIVKQSKNRNKQLLIMLIVTNLFFVFCSLPLCINIILNKFNAIIYKKSLLMVAFQILSYLNNSFNFLFYIMFSEKYRQVIASVFFRWTQKSNKNKNEFHLNKLYSLYPCSSCSSKLKSYTGKNTNRTNKFIMKPSNLPTNLTKPILNEEQFALDAIIRVQ